VATGRRLGGIGAQRRALHAIGLGRDHGVETLHLVLAEGRGIEQAAAHGDRPMRSLSYEEASRLSAAAASGRYEALIVVALRTGIR